MSGLAQQAVHVMKPAYTLGERKKGVRMTSPLTGAQLCMITTKCARQLLPLWQAEPDSHMGTFFRQKLGLEWQDELGCAYVCPPIGGFFTHKSTTCSTEKIERVLGTHFDSKWSQAGTRKMNEHQQHRWICGFTASGPAKWLGEVVKLPQDLEELRGKKGIKFADAAGGDLGNYGRKLLEFTPVFSRRA